VLLSISVLCTSSKKWALSSEASRVTPQRGHLLCPGSEPEGRDCPGDRVILGDNRGDVEELTAEDNQACRKAAAAADIDPPFAVLTMGFDDEKEGGSDAVA
jgi:hypothetical protein